MCSGRKILTGQDANEEVLCLWEQTLILPWTLTAPYSPQIKRPIGLGEGHLVTPKSLGSFPLTSDSHFPPQSSQCKVVWISPKGCEHEMERKMKGKVAGQKSGSSRKQLVRSVGVCRTARAGSFWANSQMITATK